MSLTRLLSALPEPHFSKYKIDCVLGVGAYAVVYRISDKRSGEAYALKVIEKEPMKVRLMLPQLAREAALLQAHSDTPHIVQLLETTMTPTHVFLRFELCSENLEHISDEQGPMTEEEALNWFRQACVGVDNLHAAGVIHRDLKPSNFLVDSNRMLCICDFGWACSKEEQLNGQCGTPEYSSPETMTVNGPIHTSKVDVYGLGVTLQHLLLGRVPKGRKDLPKSISTEMKELIAELTDSDPAIRPSVAELLSRPELSESIITQLWSQWRSFFNVPPAKLKQEPDDAPDASCGLGGFPFWGD